MASLHARGVGTGVHYLSISEHPAYAHLARMELPNAVAIGRETMSLPLGGALTDAQQDRVVKTMTELLTAPPPNH